MKFKQSIVAVSFLVFSSLLIPSMTFALGNTPPPGGDPTENCPGEDAVETAVGCIPVGNTGEFTEFLLRWGMGIGGGIALLLIGYGGFQVITAGGNPQKVQAGKELMTASLAGLLFIIFSAFLLRLVGIDILGIAQLEG